MCDSHFSVFFLFLCGTPRKGGTIYMVSHIDDTFIQNWYVNTIPVMNVQIKKDLGIQKETPVYMVRRMYIYTQLVHHNNPPEFYWNPSCQLTCTLYTMKKVSQYDKHRKKDVTPMDMFHIRNYIVWRLSMFPWGLQNDSTLLTPVDWMLWLDLLIKFTVIPVRIQVTLNLRPPSRHSLPKEDDIARLSLEVDNQFYLNIYKDKTGTKSARPLSMPVGSVVTHYLGIYMRDIYPTCLEKGNIDKPIFPFETRGSSSTIHRYINRMTFPFELDSIITRQHMARHVMLGAFAYHEYFARTSLSLGGIITRDNVYNIEKFYTQWHTLASGHRDEQERTWILFHVKGPDDVSMTDEAKKRWKTWYTPIPFRPLLTLEQSLVSTGPRIDGDNKVNILWIDEYDFVPHCPDCHQPRTKEENLITTYIATKYYLFACPYAWSHHGQSPTKHRYVIKIPTVDKYTFIPDYEITADIPIYIKEKKNEKKEEKEQHTPDPVSRTLRKTNLQYMSYVCIYSSSACIVLCILDPGNGTTDDDFVRDDHTTFHCWCTNKQMLPIQDNPKIVDHTFDKNNIDGIVDVMTNEILSKLGHIYIQLHYPSSKQVDGSSRSVNFGDIIRRRIVMEAQCRPEWNYNETEPYQFKRILLEYTPPRPGSVSITSHWDTNTSRTKYVVLYVSMLTRMKCTGFKFRTTRDTDRYTKSNMERLLSQGTGITKNTILSPCKELILAYGGASFGILHDIYRSTCSVPYTTQETQMDYTDTLLHRLSRANERLEQKNTECTEILRIIETEQTAFLRHNQNH